MMYMMTPEQHAQIVDALMCGVIALNHHNLPLECAPLHEARLMLKAMQPVSPVEANNDHVICPQCCHQFRAIPVNVQEDRRMLLEALKKAWHCAGNPEMWEDQARAAIAEAEKGATP
jgi:hypothetical protein